MSDARSRDTGLDDWLQHLTAEVSPATPECLDADTTAAWADGLLDDLAVDRARRHTAGCSRCQALMAVLADTSTTASAGATAGPVAARTAKPWTWAIPLAAAASLVLAVLVWQRAPAPGLHGGPHVAPTRTDTAYAPAERSDAAPPRQPGEEPGAVSDAPTGPGSVAARPDAPAGSRERGASAGNRSAQTPAAAAGGGLASGAGSPEPFAQKRQESAAAAPPARALADQAAVPERRLERSARESIADAAPPSVPASPAATPSASAVAAAAAAPRSLPESSAADLLTPTSWAAPGGLPRWRIVGGELQRSADRTGTWSRVDLPAFEPTAGAAPGGQVCWVVGRNGAVALALDGVSFRQLTGPTAADLLAIRAIDARAATVTAADGRTFTTRDGGATWVSP